MKVRTKSLDVVELPILMLWWLLLTLFRLRILSALGLDSRVVTARNICVEAYTNLVMCLRRMLLLTIYSRRRGRRRLLAFRRNSRTRLWRRAYPFTAFLLEMLLLMSLKALECRRPSASGAAKHRVSGGNFALQCSLSAFHRSEPIPELSQYLGDIFSMRRPMRLFGGGSGRTVVPTAPLLRVSLLLLL